MVGGHVRGKFMILAKNCPNYTLFGSLCYSAGLTLTSEYNN
jgi:hypothetical protein